jgi:hypothetical protein
MEDSLDREYMLSFKTDKKHSKDSSVSDNIKVILLVAFVIASMFWFITYESPHTQSYEDYQNQQVQEAIDSLPY